jgi:uncharacterized cupredoxin-like copper-binding protein
MKLKRAAIIALAFGLAACASAPQEVTELTLEASDFKYSVTTLEATAGQPVRLTIVNKGVLEHDFTIVEIPLADAAQSSGGDQDLGPLTEKPDLHLSVNPGETGVLEFTPSTPGRYDFHCSVVGHLELGMEGTLIVK